METNNIKNIVLKEIYVIADNLIEISFQNENNATWLNMIDTADSIKNYHIIQESNFSLINGLSGEMIFYYSFFNQTKEYKYCVFADKIYNSFLLHLDNLKNDSQVIDTGILTGLGGIIYSMIKIYEITEKKNILNDLTNFMSEINLSQSILEDTLCSITKGNAGFVISLCKYYKYCDDKKSTINLIDKCCQRLLELSVNELDLICWYPQHQKKPLAGMAHGASGYALAFHEAYIVTKNIEYQKIVEKIILFENTLFDASSNNWVDNRDFINDNLKGETIAWSHGAPGIGIVRKKLLESKLYNSEFNDMLNSDLNICIDKTIKSELIKNKDIVIFGNLGNIELLINTSNTDIVENKIRLILELSNKTGWNYGYKLKSFYKPGFFHGSSGIAYQLLRILDPSKFSSILSFE